MESVNVIGAGLAGSEAAWQVAQAGVPVRLYEMRPVKSTEAHHTANFAELVCSNSLRGNSLANAVGVLKEEMRRLHSVVITSADQTAVPAGGALAVDRDSFSELITQRVKDHPLVTVISEEITEIPAGLTIIATGPLTSAPLAQAIREFNGSDGFYFYDAAAPIIDFEKEKYFEGCMPIEVMANRGPKTMLFGPMKPVGLEDPKTGKRPYAVIQLRQDNAVASLYNIVGFQTHLKWGEQKRVFRMIPGLENAEIVRYGVMHRNSFMNAPELLQQTYQSRLRDDLFFAGQMTGVEGYVESAASGLVAGMNAARLAKGQKPIIFPQETAIGSMAYYITHASGKHFQPMNANFGLFPELPERIRDKKGRYEALANRALTALEEVTKETTATNPT
ncbi:MAG: methylenetetrahydrofolate--tRNA-(uracil(54)-C(5))-methyltransferase (FADH(2)-oxidizing) TrmFO [Enterococcus italicus]